MKDAKVSKEGLVVPWLNLRNAYRSTPHKLVDEALKKHLVSNKIRDLIMNYCQLQDEYQDRDKHVEMAYIGKGDNRLHCFKHPIALAMNMIIKSAEKECIRLITKTRVRQPPIRAYMGDMTITASSNYWRKLLLKRLEKLILWARMRFNPPKSIVLK